MRTAARGEWMDQHFLRRRRFPAVRLDGRLHAGTMSLART